MVEAEDQDAVVVDARVVKGEGFGWVDRKVAAEIQRSNIRSGRCSHLPQAVCFLPGHRRRQHADRLLLFVKHEHDAERLAQRLKRDRVKVQAASTADRYMNPLVCAFVRSLFKDRKIVCFHFSSTPDVHSVSDCSTDDTFIATSISSPPTIVFSSH